MNQKSPPLSPHLQVYRMQITMLMSIVHRITGAGLYFGLALLTLWLVSAVIGGGTFALVNGVFQSWFGQIILFLMVWALFHHMLGGFRHFVWDLGKGLDEKTRFAFAWGTLAGGFLLAVLTWVFLVWM